MTFIRDRLPDATTYFESEGLKLTGARSSKWKTTECRFHGGSDSMRVNTVTGAFACMACCGARGGDVLAYHMAYHGVDFVEAAKALGAWVEDGKPQTHHKATVLSPRAALEVLAFETMFVAIIAANLAKGIVLTDNDRQRLYVSVNRMNRIAEEFIS